MADKRSLISRLHPTAWLFAVSAASVVAITMAIATQPGCSGSACVGVGDPDSPSATIECPAGLLCYRGQCQKGCNAGTERFLACDNSDSCDSNRPNCVGGFCSVCPEAEVCIPTINICRRIDAVPMTVEPERPGPTVPKPTYALDGSIFNPEGLRPGTDAGQDVVPVNVPYTHVVFIDLAQEEDWRVGGHPKQGRFDVKAYDVRSSTIANVRWRGDRVPVAYEPPDNQGAIIEQDCMYHDLVPATNPIPVNFGDVRIDDNDDMDGQYPFVTPLLRYLASFQAGAYSASPVVPSQFMLLSQPRPPDMVGPSLVSLISLTGLGSPYTGMANWPLSSESTVPVPFELFPLAMPGEVNIAVPQNLATPAQDLIFRWTPVPTGITNAMRVRVRIASGTHEIFCELVESTNDNGIFVIKDNIVIVASLLDTLRNNVGAGSVVPIYFERTQRAGLYAPGPVSEAGTSPFVHSVTLWARHTLIGELHL